MRAGAVRQRRFPAVGTGAPLRLGQAIVGASLVLDSLRGSSLRYRHGFNPIFLRVLAETSTAILYCDLTADFESAKNRHARIIARADTTAGLSIEVHAASHTQSPAVLRAQRPGRQS